MNEIFSYPIFLTVTNKPCLIVGGGEVATRKAERLLNAGALVTVVGEKMASRLQKLTKNKKLKLEQRKFHPFDLKGKFLCIAATNNRKLNSTIAALAKQNGVLINVVDTPSESNFIVPSVVERDLLMIAISTKGRFPGYAKQLRQQLEKQFGPEYGSYLNLLVQVRQQIKSKVSNKQQRKLLYERLFALPLLDEIRAGQKPAVNSLLKKLGLRTSTL